MHILEIVTQKLLPKEGRIVRTMKTVFFFMKKYATHNSSLGIFQPYRETILFCKVQNYCSLMASQLRWDPHPKNSNCSTRLHWAQLLKSVQCLGLFICTSTLGLDSQHRPLVISLGNYIVKWWQLVHLEHRNFGHVHYN